MEGDEKSSVRQAYDIVIEKIYPQAKRAYW